MKFGSIQITKRTKEGKCNHCEKPLELGWPYATVTIRARAKSGKFWFHNWSIHIKCLGVWLLAQLVARQERRKPGGRPTGSGVKVAPEDKNRRLALLKQRMRLLKRVEVCEKKDEALGPLYVAFTAIENKLKDLGGPANINCRTTLDIEATRKKLMYGGALCREIANMATTSCPANAVGTKPVKATV